MNPELQSWLSQKRFTTEGGVWIQPGNLPPPGFAQPYHALRQKEGRVPPDELLRNFPEVSPGHPHFTEWKIRKASAGKIIRHLESRNKILQLLDVGCGNGWLAHLFASKLAAEVFAVDLNHEELVQGARVFGKERSNLVFVLNDLLQNPFPAGTFDAITLGAAVQYFPSLKELMESLRILLKPGGEIHVFDSPFYSSTEAVAAKERSRLYYAGMGFPELGEFYFHHTREEALALGGQLLHDPKGGGAFLRKIFQPAASPFPWWVFRKP